MFTREWHAKMRTGRFLEGVPEAAAADMVGIPILYRHCFYVYGRGTHRCPKREGYANPVGTCITRIYVRAALPRTSITATRAV